MYRQSNHIWKSWFFVFSVMFIIYWEVYRDARMHWLIEDTRFDLITYILLISTRSLALFSYRHPLCFCFPLQVEISFPRPLWTIEDLRNDSWGFVKSWSSSALSSYILFDREWSDLNLLYLTFLEYKQNESSLSDSRMIINEMNIIIGNHFHIDIRTWKWSGTDSKWNCARRYILNNFEMKCILILSYIFSNYQYMNEKKSLS